jgi:hypothetical protein
MRALAFLVQLLFWLLVVRFLVRGLARIVSGGGSRPDAPAPEPPRVAEDLVFDRICRTYVPRSRALSARIEGRDELFCSAECRDKALAAGARAS